MNTPTFIFREILCPVCESDKSKLLGWRGGKAHQRGAGIKTAIVRCLGCSHQYPNPMPFPSGDLDEVYIDAKEYFHGHDSERKKQNGLGLMSEFEKKLGKKGHFLDVGCGVGELLWAAKELEWDYAGIDPSSEFVRIAHEKFGVEAQVATLEKANFADNSFDAIALSGIIEHLYSPFETLCEISRILKPNGWFWFDAPNEDGLYMQIGNFYMKLRGRDWVVSLAPTFSPYHVQGFNRKSLKLIVERAGFDIKAMSTFGDISEQTGDVTFRKRIEYNAARVINWMDKLIGNGMYMDVWAQNKG